LEGRPQLPDVVQLAVHPAFREPIFRDAVAQHAALLGLGLQYVAVVPPQLEVIGRRQATGSGADDRYLATGVGILWPRDGSGRVDLEHAVRAVAVAVADRDGGIDLLATAVGLARRGAHPPEDRGEG